MPKWLRYEFESLFSAAPNRLSLRTQCKPDSFSILWAQGHRFLSLAQRPAGVTRLHVSYLQEKSYNSNSGILERSYYTRGGGMMLMNRSGKFTYLTADCLVPNESNLIILAYRLICCRNIFYCLVKTGYSMKPPHNTRLLNKLETGRGRLKTSTNLFEITATIAKYAKAAHNGCTLDLNAPRIVNFH